MEPVAEIHLWIREAEAKWLDPLHSHAEEIFRNSILPSHDHTHHIRVWNLCKSLLNEIYSFNSKIDPSLVEGILIAALFHDLGMAVSTREDHGKLSLDNCIKWFRVSGRALPQRFEEILRAIEEHDRKNEQIYGSFRPENTPGILDILSVADDLEAMGTIGIYRYAEIYLLRGIPMDELGKRILDNATNRFRKLEEACRLCPDLLEKYRIQYKELHEFYEQYNVQLRNSSNAEGANSGPLGVINYIRRHRLDSTELTGTAVEVQDYFIKLHYELDQARL